MVLSLARVSVARQALSSTTRALSRNGIQMRTFIAPTVSRRADFVQELYLKELKAYKTPAVKESDSIGNVQTFSAPKTPMSPEEADLAASLKEYETMAVDVEGQGEEAVVAGGGAAAPAAAVEDWLVEEEEEEAHH